MKLLIIDGNNLLYRTYWVSKNNKNNKEYTTNLLIYNFLKNLRSYVVRFTPEKIICTWDKKLQETPNFRKQECSEYKSNRQHNDEIYEATYPLDELMTQMGIKIMYPYHLEADDIMHYISVHNEQNIIISTDKDILQLVTETTSVYNPNKKLIYNNDNFKAIMGNTPKEFLMIKAIVGDQSDNIKGLPGYGIKRANKLIKNPSLITEEQLKIIENNINLIDLSKGWTVNEPGEKYFYREQYEKPWPNSNKNEFVNICNKYTLTNITSKINQWNIFFENENKTEELNSRLLEFLK